MIAVAFVCMSLNVFGCELDVVNAAERSETVEARTTELAALPGEPFRMLGTDIAAPSPAASRITAETTATAAPEGLAEHRSAAQPAAEWEASEEVNRTAAISASAAAEDFEMAQANQPETEGSEPAMIAETARSAPADPWIDQRESAETFGPPSEQSAQILANVAAAD